MGQIGWALLLAPHLQGGILKSTFAPKTLSSIIFFEDLPSQHLASMLSAMQGACERLEAMGTFTKSGVL